MKDFKKLNLNFFLFSVARPTAYNDGARCMLYWLDGGYEFARWGAERENFYNDSGDYIEPNNFDFYWAFVPDKF